MRIEVPGMKDERSVRIVRNALENELSRRDQNYTADVSQSLAGYIAGRVLQSQFDPIVQRIRVALDEVGHPAEAAGLQPIPYCPYCGEWSALTGPTNNMFVCSNAKPSAQCPRAIPAAIMASSDAKDEGWASRRQIVFRVPSLKTNRDANVIVAAIGRAMRGQDISGITPDPNKRVVLIAYESLNLSVKNLEHAIANAGFDADDVPANLGGSDALPHGWQTAVRMRPP
jgi:hypothetical protein